MWNISGTGSNPLSPVADGPFVSAGIALATVVPLDAALEPTVRGQLEEGCVDAESVHVLACVAQQRRQHRVVRAWPRGRGHLRRSWGRPAPPPHVLLPGVGLRRLPRILLSHVCRLPRPTPPGDRGTGPSKGSRFACRLSEVAPTVGVPLPKLTPARYADSRRRLTLLSDRSRLAPTRTRRRSLGGAA